MSYQLRVLSVIPGPEQGSSMIFCKRAAAAVNAEGVVNRTFFLQSRTSPVGVYREWRRLRREVEHFRPDVVHAHYGTMTAFLCAYGIRLPVIVTFHGLDLLASPAVSRLRFLAGRLLSQLAALRASRIVCVSDKLRRELWRRSEEAVLIPSAVNTELFRPIPQHVARHELDWDAMELVVLFNAGHYPTSIVKRLPLAQKSVAIAAERCGPIRMEVMDGSTPPDRVPLLMNAADCLLMTSSHEGSPTVVKEALACNLPVVSVDVGDVAERIRGVTPSAIVGDSAPEIGGALGCILAERKRSNGRSAVELLEERRIALRTIALYNLAAESRTVPAGHQRINA